MTDKITKTIASMHRMKSSVNGNPRFKVIFTDGVSAPTAPDAGWSYGAENPEYRGGPVVVHLNDQGHIEFIEARS